MILLCDVALYLGDSELYVKAVVIERVDEASAALVPHQVTLGYRRVGLAVVVGIGARARQVALVEWRVNHPLVRLVEDDTYLRELFVELSR